MTADFFKVSLPKTSIVCGRTRWCGTSGANWPFSGTIPAAWGNFTAWMKRGVFRRWTRTSRASWAARGLGKFYRMDEEQREAVKDFVNNMKRQNLIRDAASPWNSPLLAVPKTDQSAGIVRQCPKLAITVPIAGPEKQANHGYGPTLRHKLPRHWKSVHRRRHGSHGFSSMA